jgi:hypothetical protein
MQKLADFNGTYCRFPHNMQDFELILKKIFRYKDKKVDSCNVCLKKCVAMLVFVSVNVWHSFISFTYFVKQEVWKEKVEVEDD